MSSEAALWTWLKDGMREYWHATRVEDSTRPGYPDIEYRIAEKLCAGKRSALSSGVLELKHLEAWPKRAATPVRIKHLTPQQVHQLELEGRLHGRSYLLLQVGEELLLFPWFRVAQIAKGVPRAELNALACHKLTRSRTREGRAAANWQRMKLAQALSVPWSEKQARAPLPLAPQPASPG